MVAGVGLPPVVAAAAAVVVVVVVAGVALLHVVAVVVAGVGLPDVVVGVVVRRGQGGRQDGLEVAWAGRYRGRRTLVACNDQEGDLRKNTAATDDVVFHA